MAITNKRKGTWGLNDVYNKVNQKNIWGREGAWFAWGENYPSSNAGALGQNQSNQAISSPVQVGSKNNWTHVVTGGTTSLASNSKGELWITGRNYYGQLGQAGSGIHPGGPGYQHPSDNDGDISSPVQIPGIWNISNCDIVDSDGYKLIKNGGELWVWGKNSMGQLGDNGRSSLSSPIQVGRDNNWASVSAWATTMAIKTNGTLWVWGENSAGELGILTGGEPEIKAVSSPTQVPGTTWARATSFYRKSFAIKSDGTLWGWGQGTQGTLGLNQSTQDFAPSSHGGCGLSSPTQIPGTNWKQLGGSNQSIIAVKGDGTLWAWGSNSSGNLGINNRTDYSSPVQVGSGTDWEHANKSASGSAMSAIKKDGTLWVWGDGRDGRLGQNTIIKYSSPTQIPGKWFNSMIGNACAFGIKEMITGN